MAADIPTSIPSALVAGTTWEWTLSLADYPASSWSSAVYFENSKKAFSASASASGDDHAFSVAASATAAYPSGRYKWRLRVTDGTSVYVISNGRVDVEVDPAAAGTSDPRSWARRTLDAVEAFLEGNASTAQASMTIQGRSIARWSLAELTQWRDKLRAEVRTEEQGDKAGLGRNIKVRFGRV